jgi:tetratricopeptide (TPR) repeat protein
MLQFLLHIRVLSFSGLLALVLMAGISCFAESPALTEATRALYRGDYGQAIQLADKHLRKFPNDAPARVILARAELAQGKIREGFAELQKALVSDPHNIDGLYYLSLVARELSQQEYQRLFAMAPESSRTHQLLAEAALGAENPSEAEAEFQKALQSNPRSVEVLTGLAELKRSQSKFDEAITYYTQAEHVDSANYDAAYGLGACYTYKQDYPQATVWLRKAVALAPDSAASRFALGNVLFQAGQLEAAIPELKSSLQLEPRLKQAYFLLGRAYSKLGRHEEAKAALKKLDELSRSEVPGQEKVPSGIETPKPEMPK